MNRNLKEMNPGMFMFKLLRVPVELQLNEVVEAIKSRVMSIISIYRIFDYLNVQRCDEVLLVIRDPIEFAALQTLNTLFLGTHECILQFGNWRVGAASRSISDDNVLPDRIGSSPVSLKISGLLEIARVTTLYISRLLSAFESWESREVTGITFSYDWGRDCIRPFGFVSFASMNAMSRFDQQIVELFSERLACEASLRVPIVVNADDSALLDPIPVVLSNELIIANQLNSTPLARTGSQSDLAAAVMDMHLNEPVVSAVLLEEMIDAQNEKEPSDTDSVISLDQYDFDEDFNLVKKT